MHTWLSNLESSARHLFGGLDASISLMAMAAVTLIGRMHMESMLMLTTLTKKAPGPPHNFCLHSSAMMEL